jgi:hypothetical protein
MPTRLAIGLGFESTLSRMLSGKYAPRVGYPYPFFERILAAILKTNAEEKFCQENFILPAKG